MLVERTADPSTAVGMTKGRVGASIQKQMLVERTADPSTSVGMTKVKTAAMLESLGRNNKP
jgi:hypothetical protein